MRSFREFVSSLSYPAKPIDESQIDTIYSKSKISVELVRWYNPRLLDTISTIANLATGVYGIFNSGENQRQLPPDVEQNLIYYGHVSKGNIRNIPKKTLMQYYPNVKEDQIRDGYTVHVNVRRILRESKSDFEAVIQIASTIVHESTHKTDFQNTGKAPEGNAYGAERQFMDWVRRNMQAILSKYPDLKPDDIASDTEIKSRH